MPVEVVGFSGPEIEKSLGAFIKQVTIATAERVLREEVVRGFDAEPIVVTDGVVRRDYHDVRIGGRIEFIRRPEMADAVLWALEELRRRSPVLTGRYRDAHMVMVNGVQILGNVALELRKVQEGDRVQIVNPVPYAKKIEARPASRKRGITRQAGQSAGSRAGVYQPVLRSLVQRYGRSMFFDFKYVRLSTGLKYVRPGKGRRSKAGRDYVYPALQFFIKPGTGLPN